VTLWDRAAGTLRLLEPERAHHAALRGVASLPRMPAAPADPRLAVHLLGLSFPSPVGLAAGFDKNGAVPRAMLALGFGFVEIGTVTPLPQAGNPPPRLFRLPADRALINRLGFNNEGHEAAPASSASISAPIATATIASTTMSPASACSGRWRLT
jgi:dihydroorotate dehydrogenase